MSPIVHIGPNFPQQPADAMRKGGPMILVDIKTPSGDRSSGPTFALIDTGASISVIDESIATALFGSEAGGASTVTSPEGVRSTRELEALLWVPQMDEAFTMKVITAPLVAQGITALLGRDFLADKVLIYNGKTGHVTLCR